MCLITDSKTKLIVEFCCSARPTKGSLTAQTQYLSICLSVAMQILKRYRSFYSLRRLCNICQEDSKPFQCFFEHMKPAVKNSSWIGNVTMTVLFLATFHERYFGFFPQRFFLLLTTASWYYLTSKCHVFDHRFKDKAHCRILLFKHNSWTTVNFLNYFNWA